MIRNLTGPACVMLALFVGLGWGVIWAIGG